MLQCPWLVISALILLSGPAVAQSAPRENVVFAYAQVLRADPIYERVFITEQVERCEEGRDGRRTVIGTATLGGAIANRPLTADRGRPGFDNEDDDWLPAPGCDVVEVTREENQLAGYDVEYRYRGDVFISRIEEDPGDRLRIRVGVSPAVETSSR